MRGSNEKGRRGEGGAFKKPSLLLSFSFIPFSVVAACGDVTVDAIGVGAGDGGASGDGAIGDGATGDGALDASPFCQGSGPAIPISGGKCVGDIVHKLFRFAACACTSAQVSGKLRTDSFKSGGVGAPIDVASLAANGFVATNSHATLGGSVYAGGASLAQGQPAVSLSADGTIARDVRSGGDVLVNGVFQVTGDVYTTGDVKIQSGSLATVGKVHVTSGHTANGVTGGGVVTESVQVVPPCDCADAIDVGAIARSFATSNDDAMGGVTPTSLDHPAGPVTLDCGRYYFDGIAGGDVTLHLTGRAGIFIGGDVKVTGALTIDLSPGAEVDLFVAGNFSLDGPAAFGSIRAPAKVRVYVGGSMTMSGNASVGANLYAPNADLQISSAFEMSGAVYARSLAFSGDFVIHYDESVLDVTGCAPPGGSCATCNDCAGTTPACKGGSCAACSTTADCCAPLVCEAHSGRCVLAIR